MHKTIAFILHFLLFTMMIMLSACASGPSSPSLTPAQQATLDVPNASATPKLIPSATITPIPTSLSNILVGDWMLAGVIADDRTINKAVLFQILSANKLQIPDFADTPLKIFSDNSFLLNLTLKNASFQEQQIMGGKYKKINDGYEFELENIGLQKNETYRLSGVYIIDNLLIFPKWFGQSEKWVFIKKSDLIRNPTSTLKPFGEIGGVRWSLAGFAPLQYISNQLYIPASEITEAQKAMTKQWANDYYKQFKSSPAPFLQNPLFVFFDDNSCLWPESSEFAPDRCELNSTTLKLSGTAYSSSSGSSTPQNIILTFEFLRRRTELVVISNDKNIKVPSMIYLFELKD